jgi:hypothetical protein
MLRGQRGEALTDGAEGAALSNDVPIAMMGHVALRFLGVARPVSGAAMIGRHSAYAHGCRRVAALARRQSAYLS